MNPVLHPEAWDVTIAGVTWSGEAKVAGLKLAVGWDIKEAEGQKGASLTRKTPRKLSQFSIRFGMVYDPTQDIDQFSEWYDTWLPLLKSCFVGAEPVALRLEHAEAQALEVDSIVVASISQVDGDIYAGEGYADVELIQYAPAKSASTSGPNGSKGGTGASSGATDPNDPIQQRIDALDALLDGP